MAKILTKNSFTAGVAPAGLSAGELAVNVVDKKIFVGNAVGGVVTLHDQQSVVTSVNGATGAITNVAKLNEVQTFTAGQTFNASVANTIDIISNASGQGLRVGSSGLGRYGAITLGRSLTTTQNTYLQNFAGFFGIYNGTSSAGQLLSVISPSECIFYVPLQGLTFYTDTNSLNISKSTFDVNDSASINIVGTNSSGTQYYSNIQGNTFVTSGTTHILPATSGTLLNTSSSYVSSVNGITGPVGIAAGSNITISASGKTLTISSTASGSGSATGFTYASSAPGSPAIGDRWIDSDTGKEYVYVNDGSSSQWIEPVSSNGLSGVTYTPSIRLLEFGVTGSFVKLGINNTSPQYTLDVNGMINTPVGISASGATFSGAVVSDGGYRITSSAINAQSGTTYTLLTTDNGKIITMNNGSTITLTVPTGLPIGFNTTVIQLGSGQVGITAASTTLNSFEGKLKLAGQHAAASIISYTTNVFNVAGGLTG